MLNTSETPNLAHAHPLVDELFVLGCQLVKCSPVNAHRRCRSLREARQAEQDRLRVLPKMLFKVIALTYNMVGLDNGTH